MMMMLSFRVFEFELDLVSDSDSNSDSHGIEISIRMSKQHLTVLSVDSKDSLEYPTSRLPSSTLHTV